MIRVMVVDDSALVRRIVTDILGRDPEISVVATAAQAEFALAKLDREQPDVITLDMEMPGMGGLEAIRRIMVLRPTPIIVLSAHAREGADLTLQALDMGAVDFVLKPAASLSGGVEAVARELVEKVRNAARIAMLPRDAAAPSREDRSSSVPEPGAASEAHRESPQPAPHGVEGSIDLIAIGTSTGGPVALKTVLTMLPGDLQAGIVVVQHMPPVFTKAFADRLDASCALEVKEAGHGDAILPGRALIAPGDWHMTVARSGGAPRVLLDRGATVSGHRPSVDVLMHSVAREYGSRALGVIMTGMGKDGAEGLRALRQKGGRVIAQDKETSVIYGMNREVVRAGDASEVVPVEKIAGRLREAVQGRLVTGAAR